MSNRSSPLRYVSAFFFFALSIFAITWVAKQFFTVNGGELTVAPSEEAPADLLAYERNTIHVFQTASPSVVFVHNIQKQFNRRTWMESEIQQGTGSGFLWDKQGHIVTNFHVIQGATRVAVTLIDGNTYEAKLVGAEPGKDLAVLKIDLLETNITPLGETIADSSELQVGQKTIAIGNPFGLDHTLTVGNVSALGRSMSSIVKDVTIRDMIQTDAAINPGNSGGPLLDSKGRLIGMNTLILRNSTGIGFAVPANTIGRIVAQIIKYGKPIRSGIGISIISDAKFARLSARLGVPGILLDEVVPESPADSAGLRGTSIDRMGQIVLGDVIQKIDGNEIRRLDDMYHAFDLKKAGDEVEIEFHRDGERFKVKVELVTLAD